MIRQVLAAERSMYFEFCEVQMAEISTTRDVARAEFAFMLLHTGELLPGNLRADGLSLFPDPTIPKVPSLIARLAELKKEEEAEP